MSFEMNADVFNSLQSVSLTVACYDDDEEIIDSTDEYEILGSIPCSNVADTLVRNALNLKNGDKPLDDGNYVQNISFKDIQPDASTVK